MMTGLIIWSVVGPILTFVAGALAGSADDDDELEVPDRSGWDGRYPSGDARPAGAPRMPGLGHPCDLCGRGRYPGAARPGTTAGPVGLYGTRMPALPGWEERP